MLNISPDRRFLATVFLRRNQPKLKTGRSDSNQVPCLQHRRTIDTVPVQECPVATEIADNILPIVQVDNAMPPGHAGHFLLQIQPALFTRNLRPQNQWPASQAVGIVSKKNVGWLSPIATRILTFHNYGCLIPWHVT